MAKVVTKGKKRKAPASRIREAGASAFYHWNLTLELPEPGDEVRNAVAGLA